LIRLHGWQKEIFDSFTDPRVQDITLKVGTQLVKTLFIQVATAYVIAEAPGPILISQYKDSDAEQFSKERIAPMLVDCPILQGLISEPYKRSSANTTTYKEFPGGSLSLVGAGAAGNAARRTIQYYFGDEVNKYPIVSGEQGEGSFTDLAEERTAPFRSRAKRIYCCSPTGPRGVISVKYEATDQRKPWAPCWFCGFPQILSFRYGVVWDPTGTIEERAATARYVCANCKQPWNDIQRWKSADASEWRAERPFWGKAGFWINHLWSLDKKLSQIALKHLVATEDHNDEALKVFVNTNLAEEWLDKGEAPEWSRLKLQAQDFLWSDGSTDFRMGLVPHNALFLTCSVDIQGDRIEVEIRGWGRRAESWSILYDVLQPTKTTSDGKRVICRTNEPEPWRDLAAILDAEWPCAGGGTMPIWLMGIDTGYSSQEVYDFCLHHPQMAHGAQLSRVATMRTVVPIKGGHSAVKLIEGISATDAAKKRHGLRIVTIGASAAKQNVFDSLWKAPDDEESMAGVIHFPLDYTEVYFKGLCSEERFVKKDGTVEFRKKPGARNEPLDLAGYNRALAELCGVSRFTEKDWIELERRREALSIPVDLPAAARPPQRRPQIRLGGF